MALFSSICNQKKVQTCKRDVVYVISTFDINIKILPCMRYLFEIIYRLKNTTNLFRCICAWKLRLNWSVIYLPQHSGKEWANATTSIKETIAILKWVNISFVYVDQSHIEKIDYWSDSKPMLYQLLELRSGYAFLTETSIGNSSRISIGMLEEFIPTESS